MTTIATPGPSVQTDAGQPQAGQASQCLRIRMASLSLLVPRILVAEVAEPGELHFSASGSTDIHHFKWRGYQVPLLDARALGCHERVITGISSRILILHGLSYQEAMPFYGLPATTNPTLVMVNEDCLVPDTGNGQDGVMVMPVQLNGEAVGILKVDPVEKFIHDRVFHKKDNEH